MDTGHLTLILLYILLYIYCGGLRIPIGGGGTGIMDGKGGVGRGHGLLGRLPRSQSYLKPNHPLPPPTPSHSLPFLHC